MRNNPSNRISLKSMYCSGNLRFQSILLSFSGVLSVTNWVEMCSTNLSCDDENKSWDDEKSIAHVNFLDPLKDIQYLCVIFTKIYSKQFAIINIPATTLFMPITTSIIILQMNIPSLDLLPSVIWSGSVLLQFSPLSHHYHKYPIFLITWHGRPLATQSILLYGSTCKR